MSLLPFENATLAALALFGKHPLRNPALHKHKLRAGYRNHPEALFFGKRRSFSNTKNSIGLTMGAGNRRAEGSDGFPALVR